MEINRQMRSDLKSHPTISLFQELLVPSPSGCEKGVPDIIRLKLTEYDFTFETDPAGNIIVRLPGADSDAPLIIFAAHMDEIGMVVTSIDSSGDLSVTKSGGLYPWKLGEGPLDIFGDYDTIQGVLSMGSTHTTNSADQTIFWKDVRVITGLSPTQLKDAGVRPGTPALPIQERRGPVIFGDRADPLVGAWTFDDRMGCVTLLHLLNKVKEKNITPKNPSIIAFTTQEETGGHGAKYLARSTNPEVFVAVDGSPIPPETKLKIDGRPGIWSKDRIAHYDQELIRLFSEAAIRAGTELQPAIFEAAASDASLAAYALGVPKIACIGHVRENSHGFEVARLSVFQNLLNTLIQFISTYSSQLS
jgi:putative aminopeptidase FrvX